MIDFMNERKLMDLVNSWDYVPSYEDKDGDWMLVGDVPWPYVFLFLINYDLFRVFFIHFNNSFVIYIYIYIRMFVDTCKRLRLMKGSDAIGLGMYFLSMHFILFAFTSVHRLKGLYWLKNSQRVNVASIYLETSLYRDGMKKPYLLLSRYTLLCTYMWHLILYLVVENLIFLISAPRAMEKCHSRAWC